MTETKNSIPIILNKMIDEVLAKATYDDRVEGVDMQRVDADAIVAKTHEAIREFLFPKGDIVC